MNFLTDEEARVVIEAAEKYPAGVSRDSWDSEEKYTEGVARLLKDKEFAKKYG